MKMMKKWAAFLFMAAAVVACNPKGGEEVDPNNEDEPVNPNENEGEGEDPKPADGMPVVEAVDGAVVVVWNNLADVCSDLVFAGDYNNYSTNAAEMVHFEAIEGYDGWYKAVVTPADPSADPILQGKPCACAKDGSFPSSWDHQWIGTDEQPLEILKGEGELEAEYGAEMKLKVAAATKVIYVRSYAYKANPCVEVPTYTVKFHMTTTVAVPAEATVNIVGAMQGWNIAEAPAMTRIDDNNFEISLDGVKMDDEYKYVVNNSWDNDQMLAPEEGADCSNAAGNFKVDFEEMENEVYGFLNFGATRCEAPAAE